MLAKESLSGLYQRIRYACQQALKLREAIKSYRHDAKRQLATITDLNCLTLKNAGIQALAIDFDGVLACHGEEQPLPQVVPWLKESLLVFGPGHVFIYTNRPTTHRLEYFHKNFPGIEMIDPAKRKPYPEGLLQILKQSQVDRSRLVVIDDRLLTGILSAIIVGVPALWVTQPFFSLRKGALQTELFIMLLRKLERLFF